MTARPDRRTAQCLCGAVRITAVIPDGGFQLCHCEQCQRWTGGGPLTAIRAKEIEITGQDAIETYHASDHGARAFCKVCGTTLYWKMQDHPLGFLPVGLFDDQSGFTVTEEIFVDKRPDWLPPHDGASQQDEAEMQAQLAAFLEQN